MNKKNLVAKKIVESYFKDDRGQPFIMSEGQCELFNAVFLKEYNRVQAIAPTQYGKSSTIAKALILRSQVFGEDFAIVTGSSQKSKVIMEKVIQHTFDDERLYSQLMIDKNEPLERIKRERSKDRVMWRCGGSIRTFTADSRNRGRVIESLTGLGSANIIEDEASLIQDDLQAMILRMLGGHAGGFLMKIGNPFLNNHFKKTSQSNKYHQIFIDYKQGLKEGRYTQEFIDEMREQPFFSVLYECQFPDDNALDMSGFYRLVNDEIIHLARQGGKHDGHKVAGVDVGEGGDPNVIIVRSASFAEKIHISRTKDLMALVRVVVDELIIKRGMEPEDIFIDATGIGAGVVARLHEMDYEVVGVKWAEKADDSGKFSNLKAENHWEMKQWLDNGGKVGDEDGFNELAVVKYKEDTAGRLKIKSKEDMRKEGIPSPNYVDALALTFNKSSEEEINVRSL